MRKRRVGRQDQYKSSAYRGLQAALARNVRRLREARGWTQEVAAAQADMSARLLQRIEARDVNATLTTLARLVEGFEIEPEDLLAAGKN